VKATIEKVRFVTDPEAEAAGYNTMTSIIRVRMKDGRQLEARAAFAKGSPANPMSVSELRDKFGECLAVGGIGADAGRRAADLILDLESQPDLGEITSLLSAGPADRARVAGGLAGAPARA
jgi:2-methylcitrate dehydratase PrpD